MQCSRKGRQSIKPFLLLSGHEHAQRAVTNFRHRRPFGIMVAGRATSAYTELMSQCCVHLSALRPRILLQSDNDPWTGPT